MKLNRRDFLALAALLSGQAVFQKGLFAQSRPVAQGPSVRPRFFVFLQVNGGMDVTLGLDPQILPRGYDSNDMFLDYHSNEMLQAGALRFGPSAAPLVPFASEIAIVNGINMRVDVMHEPMNELMRIGDHLHQNDFILRLADLQNEDSGIVCNTHLAVNGIKNLPFEMKILAQMFEENPSSNFLLLQELPQDPVIAQVLKDYSRFLKKSPLVREQKAEAVEILKTMNFAQADQELLETMAWTAALFKGGVFRNSFIWLDRASGDDLDTHVDYSRRHLRAQHRVWSEVASLLTLFKKIPYEDSSLFDHTLFLVTSEMSRTPFRNSFLGKDHNVQTTSFLLAGAGISGGRTFGASQVNARGSGVVASHIGRPYDFSRGRPLSNEEILAMQRRISDVRVLHSEDIFASISQGLGYPKEQLVTQGRMIPGLFKV